jgi:hypothetical protein
MRMIVKQSNQDDSINERVQKRRWHKRWRASVRLELAKFLKGENEPRDLIYFSGKLIG